MIGNLGLTQAYGFYDNMKHMDIIHFNCSHYYNGNLTQAWNHTKIHKKKNLKV